MKATIIMLCAAAALVGCRSQPQETATDVNAPAGAGTHADTSGAGGTSSGIYGTNRATTSPGGGN